ncbi:hypothetical protein IWX49DRAFT_70600 [Phyllosticta citricarpa]
MMLSLPYGYAAVPILVLPPILCACGFSSALIQQRNTLRPSQSMSAIHPHPFFHTCPALPCPACLTRVKDARCSHSFHSFRSILFQSDSCLPRRAAFRRHSTADGGVLSGGTWVGRGSVARVRGS